SAEAYSGDIDSDFGDIEPQTVACR
ncbi:MAG: hypothetical protein K1000chlam4_00794, partial [Chlamydiae bacterium]|nr:hypothetical protein [Chlamydiota bacterium]